MLRQIMQVMMRKRKIFRLFPLKKKLNEGRITKFFFISKIVKPCDVFYIIQTAVGYFVFLINNLL